MGNVIPKLFGGQVNVIPHLKFSGDHCSST